ncbi:MAG: PQQ-dependent sugar dehydrogenase [Candidatus Wildermuthbacteria bacterium]|nr:PQQ-dependent sugar dehydrogenase [Candidatus Wildermuthbacteria bacterium]
MLVKIFFLSLFVSVGIMIPLLSYALPSGFQIETVTSGLQLPTSIAFAPDGHIFVAEKSGAVRIVHDGVLMDAPFLQLQDVNDYGDHGILGIALDPDFENNGWVYLSYTYENNPANYEGPKTGRIVRVKAEGDMADMNTLEVLVGTVGGTPTAPSCEDFEVTEDCIPSDDKSHTMGGLRFGPDGKLYATLGDGASFDFVDPRAERAQNIDSLAGKMLRLNTDGTGPSDNPFYNGDPSANRSKVWNYGYRNAFRFNFNPSNGELYVGDVGWFTWEEINKSIPGGNYGWPCREGAVQNPGGYTCVAENYVDPLYAYGHDATSGASVTAGAFIFNAAYPAQYQGNYLFGDFTQNWLKLMVLDADGHHVVSVDPFSDDAGGPVEIVSGPDGLIYYLSIYAGELQRITYTTGNRNPEARAAANPTAGLVPLFVSFSSVGSNDLDGDSLSFSWDFGDGVTSAEANPTHTYETNGTYEAVLSVNDGNGGIGTSTIQIVVGNERPTAQITSPPNNSTYRPGQIIPLVGQGTDPEDGNLPESAYFWRILEHHTAHIHILQTFTGTANPSFIAPSEEDADIYVEAELTVTDSIGLQDTTSIDLRLAPPPTVEPHHVQTVLDNPNPVVEEQLSATTTITNAGTEDAILVDLEIYNAAGLKVAQQFYDNEVIPTATTKDYTISWTPQAAGNYRIAVGLIHTGWQGLYEWTNEAKLFSVGESNPTPTPNPSGSDALVFDGVDDYVDVDDWDIEEPNFTIEARFRADRATGTQRLLSKARGEGTADQLWMLGIRDNTLQFALETGGVVDVLEGGTIAQGEWTHVAAVYNGSEMRLYQNGSLVGSLLKTGAITEDRTKKVWIGDNPDTGSHAFAGVLDVMRVWNVARSDAQIASTQGNNTSSEDRAGLIKDWTFDEGFGQDVLDRSNSGHHGRLGSTPGGDENDPSWESGGPTVMTGTFAPRHQGTTAQDMVDHYRISSSVENTGSDPGHLIVDIEVYDGVGAQVFQRYFDGVTLQVGETRSFSIAWTPPASGQYRVAVGLIELRWAGVHEWVNEAALIDTTQQPPPQSTDIFTDALAPGWASWSWETDATFVSAIEVEFAHQWGGLYLHHDAFDTTGMNTLNFSISGGSSGGQDLQIFAFDEAGNALAQKRLSSYLPEALQPNIWYNVSIPLADLQVVSGSIVTGISIMGASGNIEPIFFLDDIRLSS